MNARRVKISDKYYDDRARNKSKRTSDLMLKSGKYAIRQNETADLRSILARFDARFKASAYKTQDKT
jgi:hypothetical protein